MSVSVALGRRQSGPAKRRGGNGGFDEDPHTARLFEDFVVALMEKFDVHRPRRPCLPGSGLGSPVPGMITRRLEVTEVLDSAGDVRAEPALCGRRHSYGYALRDTTRDGSHGVRNLGIF